MPFLDLFLLTFVCSALLVLRLAWPIFIPFRVTRVLLVTIFVASCGPKFGAQSKLTFESHELCLHCINFLFFKCLSDPLSSLHEQVVFVGGEKDELFMGEGSCSVGVLIRFVFDVQSKKSAWYDGVGGKENVDRIVDSSTVSNDLGVIGVKIGMEEIDVAFEGGAICRNLPQIRAKGFGGGRRVDSR